MGPAASQIAINPLGTNGGGFFNVNSAHPFENPTPLSSFFETLAILLYPGHGLLHLRQGGGPHPPGLGGLAAMVVTFVGAAEATIAFGRNVIAASRRAVAYCRELYVGHA